MTTLTATIHVFLPLLWDTAARILRVNIMFFTKGLKKASKCVSSAEAASAVFPVCAWGVVPEIRI